MLKKLFAGELPHASFKIEAPHGNFWLRDGEGRFDFWPVLSEEHAEGRRFGLVTNEIPAAIAELDGIAGLQAYMCGPPGMIDAGLATLAEAGVALGDIYYDKFTDASTRPGN